MDKNNLISRSFIGKLADDLGNLIYVQIKPVYESLGIEVPVKSCSIIHALDQTGGASLVDLAKALKQSHQLVKQKLPKLLKMNLIVVNKDPDDKRRLIYTLTEKGQAQAELLNANPLEKVYADLSREVDTDLYAVLDAAITGLKNKDLLSRYREVKNHG